MVTFTLSLTDEQYDVFHAALNDAIERNYGVHQQSVEALEEVLDQLRRSDEVEFDLSEYQLNTAYAALNKKSIDHNSRGIGGYADATASLLKEIGEIRHEVAF